MQAGGFVLVVSRVSKRNAPSPLQSVHTGMVTESTFLTRQNLQVASRGVLAAPQGSPNRGDALLQKSPTSLFFTVWNPSDVDTQNRVCALKIEDLQRVNPARRLKGGLPKCNYK